MLEYFSGRGDCLDLFEEIYRQNFDKVFRFLQKLTGNYTLSEDLAQETFLRAFESFERFDGSCEIYTWLISIAKHVYYKYLKKNKMMLQSSNLDVIIDTYQTLNTDENPPEAFDRKLMRDAIIKVIGKLPEKYRDVVILRIYGEMNFSQVGFALGISENSAKVIYCRAKKMLKEEFENEIGL